MLHANDPTWNYGGSGGNVGNRGRVRESEFPTGLLRYTREPANILLLTSLQIESREQVQHVLWQADARVGKRDIARVPGKAEALEDQAMVLAVCLARSLGRERGRKTVTRHCHIPILTFGSY